MNLKNELAESRIIAILRGISEQEIKPVCDILEKNGIKILEIPLNTPDAFRLINIAAAYAGDRMHIGAGTVLAPQEVKSVAESGGKFIISPNTDADVISETKRLGMISIPGFFSPTEAFAAIKAGADFLKLFPAGTLGPQYVKDLKAVIKKPVIAVGGVNSANLKPFLEVCAGAGIGSALYKNGKSLAEIEKSAIELTRSVI